MEHAARKRHFCAEQHYNVKWLPGRFRADGASYCMNDIVLNGQTRITSRARRVGARWQSPPIGRMSAGPARWPDAASGRPARQ